MQCKTERYLVWKGTKVIMKDRIISLHHTGCKNTKKISEKRYGNGNKQKCITYEVAMLNLEAN